MIIIVGRTGGSHIGESYHLASKRLGIDSILKDYAIAYQSPWLIRKLLWRFLSKYPAKLSSFSRQVSQLCYKNKAKCLITTGISPINAQTLSQIGKAEICRINYLTDDPWNPSHHADWFLKALPHYDIIFSPRKDNIKDLRNLGCTQVEYLPFGYDPALFYRERTHELKTSIEDHRSDIMFAGGADTDRLTYIKALSQAGLDIGLYGTYWERYPETSSLTRGQASVSTLRKAISNTKIALCLVRRANRDGHCMRTFEVPAVGACMLTEDTAEHRNIFGEEGQAVLYFSSVEDMVKKSQWLLAHETERKKLANAAHQLITKERHTYCDRLETILSHVTSGKS